MYPIYENGLSLHLFKYIFISYLHVLVFSVAVMYIYFNYLIF